MPAKKRYRRIVSDNDSDDDNSHKPDLTEFVNTLCEVGAKNTEDVVGVLNNKFKSFDQKANEITDKVAQVYEETQYVHKKHADQARMLATLNERIEEKHAENRELNVAIRTLHGDVRNLEENALGDCAGHMEDTNIKLANLQAKLKNVLEEVTDIKKTVKDLKAMMGSVMELLNKK